MLVFGLINIMLPQVAEFCINSYSEGESAEINRKVANPDYLTGRECQEISSQSHSGKQVGI